jgi:hypothetical protein
MKADDRDRSKILKVKHDLEEKNKNNFEINAISTEPLKGLFLDGSSLRVAKILISKSFLPNLGIALNLITAGPINSTHPQRSICFA